MLIVVGRRRNGAPAGAEAVNLTAAEEARVRELMSGEGAS